MSTVQKAQETTGASTVELPVLDASGKEISKASVPATMFAGRVAKHLLHQVVRWQLARRRAGTHSTLTRATMSGGGIKPWKQKGTGRARAGSNTSPLWVGGGIAHGPKPRDYDFSLNKKEKKLALGGAISSRNKEGKLFLLKDFGLKAIKTKDAAKVLSALGITSGDSTLVVVGSNDETAVKSFRNLENVKVVTPAGLNTYDIVIRRNLLIAESALPELPYVKHEM